MHVGVTTTRARSMDVELESDDAMGTRAAIVVEEEFVRDDDGGATAYASLDALHDDAFSVGVECGCRLV